MALMHLPLAAYALREPDRILTPALLIYPDLVDANIRTTLRICGSDPNRWRPHIKTAKLAFTIRRYLDHGILHLKCATTLELLTACECGAEDVLLAFPVVGANARRALQIAEAFPRTRLSVLVENTDQAAAWRDTSVGVFIDVNPGMNRTGIGQERTDEIVSLARQLATQFRGLHYYDGHAANFPAIEREKRVHQGYDRLLGIVRALHPFVREIITSGTPAAPFAMSYPGFRDAAFLHRISPGTVVYNDMTSAEQFPGYGYRPAAIVLSTVISHPTAHSITCDAGHKSVSADAGVPTCAVLERPDLKPQKPSEEHLPIEGTNLPGIGEKLYLVPRHVCPTVNNFDRALIIEDGNVSSVQPVSARGHE